MGEKTKLTKREIEVVQLIAKGKDRKKIADELDVSIHTVDSHIRHIHLKTDTHSLSEIVIWSLSNLNQRYIQ